MDLTAIEENESSVRSYSRSFPVVFEKASGSFLYDNTGRQYIDFFSGAGGLNYGHNNPAIKHAMINYLEKDGIIHGLDMATMAKIEFINSFQKYVLAPRKLDYRLQFTGPTGTNAVEAALKLARLVTQRSNVVSFSHAFHGVSMGALATTANSWFRNAAGVGLDNVTFMPYEGYMSGLDSIEYLEQVLNDPGSGLDLPAAVIVETIQGEGGVNVASVKWLRRLREITAERNILLIVDDIQAGCGRSGDFFSFEESNIEPDLITLSKSLSGSGLPMSMLLIKPEHDVWKPGQHNGTFRGNNLAFVSAKAALDEFWKDTLFRKDITRKSGMLRARLNSISRQPRAPVMSVRGRGLLQGLAFEDARQAKKVVEQAFTHGLVIELSGSRDEVVKFLPALTISDEVLAQGLDIIAESVNSL